MKDSEFIELLNLYLDHELSVDDAARLEAEVQNNPSRRKVYQQYCRMQKACKVLAADFESSVARDTAAAEQKIIAFNPAAAVEKAAQRRRTSAMLAFGSLAAAACLAVILVNRRGSVPVNDAATPPVTIVQTSAPATVRAQEPAQVVVESSGPRALGRQPTKLVTDPLLLTTGAGGETVMVVSHDNDEPLKWIPSLQIAPLPQHVPAEQLRFDVRPVTLRPDPRSLTTHRAPAEADVHMTAFRFQK